MIHNWPLRPPNISIFNQSLMTKSNWCNCSVTVQNLYDKEHLIDCIMYITTLYLPYLDPLKSSSPGLRREKRSGKRRQPILKWRSENSCLWNQKNLLTWFCAFCWDCPRSQWSRHHHYCLDSHPHQNYEIWAFSLLKPQCILTKLFGFNKWYFS